MENFKLITGDITKGSQSVTFKYLCSYGPHVVRFTIKSDAYKAQCSAKADIWSPVTLSWNNVAALLPEEMETEHGLVYRRVSGGIEVGSLSERHFEDDYDRLMKMVSDIVEIPQK